MRQKPAGAYGELPPRLQDDTPPRRELTQVAPHKPARSMRTGVAARDDNLDSARRVVYDPPVAAGHTISADRWASVLDTGHACGVHGRPPGCDSVG